MRRIGVAGALVALLVVSCSGREDTERIDPTVDAGEPDGGHPPPPGCSEEVCGNGLDDDCDGAVEEGCPCIPGEEAPCYLGPAETRLRGRCLDGVMVCTDGLEFGTWGECVGSVTPGDELCDPEEVDESCDGAANEGCECTGSEPLPCGTDVGGCESGVQECVDGRRGDCVGDEGPVAEGCNGIDDDCDGETDEGLTRSCGSDVGECRAGTEACVDGAWEACAGERAPAEEACDGLDNDCDGETDEGLERGCGSDVGECTLGTQRCEGGGWSACRDEVTPVVEACNGADDDCDGDTDEELSRRCGSDVGACRSGTQSCVDGAWSACAGGIEPGVERCEGAIDEDCDGTVDDGCGCAAGATRPCGLGTGLCRRGTETCRSDGTWSACAGGVAPGEETCDGRDEDCDGEIDEELTRACGTDLGVCARGTETCVDGAWGACAGGVRPGTEACDGALDEDCDGVVDEGCTCPAGATRPCGTDVGECRAGTETCRADGTWSACSGATGPAPEVCNGRDDDCDADTDESITRPCGTDEGVCRRGIETCAAGAWGACLGGIEPGPAEVCDGTLDEDCDGTVDEGCACTTGETRACGTDTGVCVRGSQLCTAGAWGPCEGGTAPTTETCDDRDEDCDGETDEGLVRSCGTDVGACVAGTETCAAGAWGACVGETPAGTEICEGSVDEDCDGLTDEGCACTIGATRSCGTDVGACVAGTETCRADGTWGACVGATGPTDESCNDIDDDCDRRTDEDLTRGCGTDTGVCVRGTQTCSRGAWGTCEGGVTPGPRELCDGVDDDDCDGLTDEGCACTDGETRSCGSDVGECRAGTETCDLMGVWGDCVGAIGPTDEVCNMLNDDCDAEVDEGGVCVSLPPTVSCPADVTAEVLSTITLSGSGSDPDGGSVTYEWTVLSRPSGSTSTPTSPASATTSFFLDAGGDYVLQLCVIDDEMDRTCCTVSVESTVPGALHVEIAWDTGYGDVDVHLLNVTRTPPDGWWTTDDCHFANTAPDWGPAGAAANPTLDRDDQDGFGPENITIDLSPASGTYNVGLHYYCSHSIGASTPDGPTTATVRIYCDGALIATYAGVDLTETDDWVTIAEVDYPSCTARRRNVRTNGTSILPASFTAPRHCEIPCTSSADCPTGEGCYRAMGGGPPRNICWIPP